MFSVIKCFQSRGARRGGRGCIGFWNLEALPRCIRLLACVYFSSNSEHPHSWQTHRITKSFSVLPAKLVSPFIPGCRCLWVKYLWKIAMIGFIMLPAVSKDGNEFGILGCEKKQKIKSLFSKYHLVRVKEGLQPACFGTSLHCLMRGCEYIFSWTWDNDELCFNCLTPLEITIWISACLAHRDMDQSPVISVLSLLACVTYFLFYLFFFFPLSLPVFRASAAVGVNGHHDLHSVCAEGRYVDCQYSEANETLAQSNMTRSQMWIINERANYLWIFKADETMNE